MRIARDYYIEILIILGYIYHIFERIVARIFFNDFDNSFLRTFYVNVSRWVSISTFLMVVLSIMLIIKSVKKGNIVSLIVAIVTLLIFGKIMIDIMMSV